MLYTVPDPTRRFDCINIFAGSACLCTDIFDHIYHTVQLSPKKIRNLQTMFQSGVTVSLYPYTSNFLSGSARFDGSIGSRFFATKFPLRYNLQAWSVLVPKIFYGKFAADPGFLDLFQYSDCFYIRQNRSTKFLSKKKKNSKHLFFPQWYMILL